MSLRAFRRFAVLVVSSTVAACGSDTVSPSHEPPAHIEALAALTRSGTVGASLPGALSVKVTDAAGKPVENVAVAFVVTQGSGGSVTPSMAVTDSKGQASATWTLGTVIGANQVVASVTDVEPSVVFSATGTAGPVTAITVTPVNPRLLVNVDSTRLTAVAVDAFGNQTSPPPTFTVRDPSLITVESNGVVRVLRRGASTYVVATAGAKTDSVLVTVLAAGQSICTAVASPVELAVGQVLTDVKGSGFCVRSSTAGAEYAIVPFFSPATSNSTLQVEVRGQGLTSLSLPSTSLARLSAAHPLAPSPVNDDAFEFALRNRERIGSMGRTTMAAATMARANAVGAVRTLSVPAVGEEMKLNVNSQNFCDQPDIRTGKVVVISDKAIIVADTANPAGGFTDAEYRSIAVTFDTLVDPTDRAAFGAPSDIDANGRVIIFFTRAVNELSTGGGVVLGFYYRRDLYPKVTSATETCVGSNAAEIMYMLVPDINGAINGNQRTKDYVITATNGTVAHEYQHMINASRRKYVNNVGEVFEDRWLDEGLAHVAEDINFWRSSGLKPKSNIDASIFGDAKLNSAFGTFGNNNMLRYRTYLQRTEIQAPIGFDAFDDDLQTRGAIWSFLRFAADHQTSGTENDFWFKLVNSNVSGVANLTKALGAAPSSLLRDWAISVFLDDNAVGVDPRFQQPSYNMRSLITNNGTSLAFPLTTRTLVDNVSQNVLMAASGVSFLRFSVPSGQEALLTTTAGGQTLPATVQLSIVRVR